MSENSVNSTVDEEEEQGDRNVKSGEMIARRLKALICCFRRERKSRGEIAEYDPDEYDYIVEKLVVKRVPVALFAIPIDLRNLHRPDALATPSGTTETTSTSTFGGSSTVVARETSHRADKISGKNEDRVSIGKRRQVVRVNLQEFKMSPRDPPNVPGSKRSFAQDIPKVTFNARTVSSETASSATAQDGVFDKSVPRVSTDNSSFGLGNEKKNGKSQVEENKRLQDAFSGRIRDNVIPARNRRYIVSPFRVQRGSFDLGKPMSSVIGDSDVNGKTYTEKSDEDESSGSIKNSSKGEDDPKSNTAMRWRITVRQRKNADPAACKF